MYRYAAGMEYLVVVVVLAAVFAASVAVPLSREDVSSRSDFVTREVTTTSDCPTISPQPHGHSPTVTSRQLGQAITFYQVFLVDETSETLHGVPPSQASSCPSSFNVTWTRYPYDLPVSKGRYKIGCNVSNTTALLVNASLAIEKLDFVDEGFYDVQLSISGCASNLTSFRLDIPDCNATNPPQANQFNVEAVVAEPNPNKPYCIDVILNGDNDVNTYTVQWKWSERGTGRERMCYDTSNATASPRFTCYQNSILNCTMTSKLCISGLTTEDSGQFTVRSFPLNTGDPVGKPTDIDLRVLPHPYFIDSKKTYSPALSSKTVSVSIGNYSEYVTACIRSATGCEQDLRLVPQPPYGATAKAEVDVDNLKGGRYYVCASYAPDVDTSYTDFTDPCMEISVKPDKAIGQLTGAIVGSTVGVVLLAAAFVGVAIGVRRWRRRRPAVDGRRHTRERSGKELKETTDTAPLLEGGARVSRYGGAGGRDVETDKGRLRGQDITVQQPPPKSSPSPPPLPSPQSYKHPSFGQIHKVTLLNAQNPQEYAEVERVVNEDGCIQNEQEIVEFEQDQRRLIRENQQTVSRFARFLQKYGVPVAYDQLLWDTSADNALRWIHRQIEESLYIILIITPSLTHFLTTNELPSNEREFIFTGQFLYNLVHSNDYKNKIIPVFLNRPKDTRMVPLQLQNAVHLYEVHVEDLERDLKHPGPEESDLRRLYRLLTGQAAQVETEFLGVYQCARAPSLTPDTPLSSNDINCLAEDSSFSLYCEAIAKHLHLSDRDIEECTVAGRGDRDEVCYQVLRRWREAVGHERATIGCLLEAVNVVDRELYNRLAQRYS